MTTPLLLLAALFAQADSQADPETARVDAPPPPRLAVLDVVAKSGFDPEQAEMLTELVQDELRRQGFAVTGRSDIEALLGFDRLREAVACDSTSCMVEIVGALGVEEIVTGTIGRLDPYLVITLKRISVTQGAVTSQATRKFEGGSAGALADAVGGMIAELFGRTVPSPPQPDATTADAGTPASEPAAGDVAAPAPAGRDGQVVAFVTEDPDASHSVKVRLGSGERTCPHAVTYLTPCELVLPAGPASFEVDDLTPRALQLKEGAWKYVIEPGNPVGVIVGISMLVVGTAGGATALGLLFSGAETEPWGETAMILTGVLGGVFAWAGALTTPFTAPLAGDQSRLVAAEP